MFSCTSVRGSCLNFRSLIHMELFWEDMCLILFFYMWTFSFPSTIYRIYFFFLLSMFLESASNYMYLHLGLWLTFNAGFLWIFPVGFIVLYCQFQQFQNFFSWLFIWLIYHSILHPMTFMTLCTYWKFACFWFCFMALYSGGIHGVIRIFLK